MMNMTQLRSTARALRAAIYDRLLEVRSRRALHFYFDTDVVVGSFFGHDTVKYIRTLDVSREHPDPGGYISPDVVARALWVTGFACQATMLWAHRREFEDIINKYHDNDKIHNTTEAVKAAKQIFTSESVRQLDNIIKQNAVNAVHNLEELAKLMPIGHLAVAVAALPTWDVRLQLIGDRLDLSEFDDVAATEIEDGAGESPLPAYIGERQELLTLLCLNLQIARSGRRKRLLYRMGVMDVQIKSNTYADVCALMQLDHSVRSGGTHVRFYTNTEALEEFMTNGVGDQLTALIPDPIEDDDMFDSGVIDQPLGVFRSTTYMLLRSVIPALAFTDRRESLPSSVGFEAIELDDLNRMVATAKSVLNDEIGATREVMEARQRLDRLITPLQSISGFLSVWSRPDSQALKFLVEHLRNLPSFGEAVTVIEKQESKISEMADVYGQAVDKEAVELWKDVRTLIERAEAAVPSGGQPVPAARSGHIANDDGAIIAVVGAMQQEGVLRWLALLAEVNGNFRPLRQKLRAQLLEFSKTATYDEGVWTEVLQDGSAPAELRLLAAGVMFCRSEPNAATTALLVGIRRNLASIADVRVRTSLRFVSECSAIISDDPGDLDMNASTDDEDEVLKMGQECYNSCIVGMRAWRAFYWCHSELVRAKLISGEPQLYPTQLAEIATTAVRPIGGWTKLIVSAHMEWVRTSLLLNAVDTMLRVIRAERIASDPVVIDFNSQYESTAYGWACAVDSVNIEYSKRVRSVERVVKKYGSGTTAEPYIMDHLAAMRAFLKARNMQA